MSILSDSRVDSLHPEKSNNDIPIIERTLDKDELKLELASVTKTRKIIMSAVWVVAVAVMIYGMVNVTPFLIEHGVSRFIAPGLPLMVDTALCVSLWGDRVLRKYSLRDGWLTTLRWSTGFMTWMLNIAQPLAGDLSAQNWTPDWVGVGVHSCGPIMLILVTEAASSFSRKASSIIQTLAKVEDEQEALDNERNKMFQEMTETISTQNEQIVDLKDNLNNLEDSSSGQLSSIEADHKREMEQLKKDYREHLERVKSESSESSEQLKSVQGGTQRLANILMHPRPVTQDANLMGRSLIKHFSSHEQLDPLLDGSAVPSTELAQQLGERIHVFGTSEQTLVVLDYGDPLVSKIVNGGDVLASNIPSSVLVTLQDNDLGAELINMVQEENSTTKEESVALMKSIISGNVDSLDNAFLTRVAVRVAMDTKRIKEKYGLRR